MKRLRLLFAVLVVLALSTGAGTASAAPLLGYSDDITSSVGATASSYYSAQVPAYAFDNNSASYWSSGLNLAVGSWIRPADFASPQSIKRITIAARNDAWVDQSPRDFSLQYYDGADWQTAQSWVNETGWTTGQMRVYDVTGDYSSVSWRVYITAINGSSYGVASVSEIQMMTYTPDATETPVATWTGGDISIYVDYPTPVPQYFDPTANNGDGPEPWLLRFYVGVFVAFGFTYMLFRLVDTNQFYLLFVALCLAAAWVTKSVNGAAYVYVFMVIALIVFKIAAGLKSLAGGPK